MFRFLLVVLCCSISIFGNAQSVFHQWSKTVFGQYEDIPDGVVTDKKNNVYHLGSFYDTVDFDPGPGVVNVAASYSVDLYIQKLDSNGNFLWVKTFDGFVANFFDFKISDNHDLYITGIMYDTVDLDPGPGVFKLHPKIAKWNTYGQGFVLKLDENGNFIWAVTFPGSSNGQSVLEAIALDPQNNVLITGYYLDTVDFDPGPGVFNLTSVNNNNVDVYIAKLDSNGNFQWAVDMGTNSNEQGQDIACDANGNVFSIGQFQSTMDFDPGAGTASLSPNGSSRDIYIQKLDPNGNYLWAGVVGGPNNDDPGNIVIDQNGDCFVAGGFSGNADLNPNVASNNFGSLGLQDIFLLKLDNNGNYIWAKSYGGVNSESINDLQLDDSGSIYLTGRFTDSLDVDPGIAEYYLFTDEPFNIFLHKLSNGGDFIWATSMGGYRSFLSLDQSSNVIIAGAYEDKAIFKDSSLDTFVVYGDSASIFIAKYLQGSCAGFFSTLKATPDLGCSSSSSLIDILVVGGSKPYSYRWSNDTSKTDSFMTITNPGVYNVTISDGIGCYQRRSYNITGSTTAGQDLAVEVFATTLRPGFGSTLLVDVRNNGCTVADGKLELILSDSVVYINSYLPTADTVRGDTIIWNLDPLSFDSASFAPQVVVYLPPTLSFPSSLCFTGLVSINGVDSDTSNNIQTICPQTVNSFDPNDKTVYPEGECDLNYILPDQKMTYRVRFQNTGTAPAINVEIRDTLDSDLDLSTLRVVSNSHYPLITEIQNGNTLVFRMDSILLPDSGTSLQLSQGYIIYEIEPIGGLSNGTVIDNKASIYFDFNKPIVTNLASNTIIDVIPEVVTPAFMSVCYGDTFKLGGNNYTQTGSYDIVYSNYLGCDSTLQLSLTVLDEEDTTDVNNGICAGDSLVINGISYSSAGIYAQTLNNQSGCDSVVEISLVMLDTSATNASYDVCQGESIDVNGQNYSTSGVFNQVFTSVNGCDSNIYITISLDTLNYTLTLNGDTLKVDNDQAQIIWLDCDNNYSVINGASGNVFVPSTHGNYAIQMNEGACQDTSACFKVNLTGIADSYLGNSLSIYPNPSSGEVSISFTSIQHQVKLRVINILGESLAQHAFSNTVLINLEMPKTSGLYFIELEIDHLQPQLYRVIVE